MLGCGRLVIVFLLIKLLNLSFVSSTSSSSNNATQPRFHPSIGTDSYDEYDDITPEPPSSSSTVSKVQIPCDYDLCVEHQKTCLELAYVTGCLCPGLSNAFTPPSPPRLTYLIQDGKGVVVHWCAPTSFVTNYIVWVKENGKVMDRKIQVENIKRKAVLEDVEFGADLCVKAVNNAGNSTESCAIFESNNSGSGLALKMGIIGGVVGLILLLILALLLWRYKTRQKSTAQPETGGVL